MFFMELLSCVAVQIKRETNDNIKKKKKKHKPRPNA